MSGIVRFISDPHFGHLNMAKKRGFQDDFYHDEYIIDKWNSVVNKGDTTWILGDITMEKREYDILSKLKGYKRVVLGNHDMGNHAKTLAHYVNSLHGMVKIRGGALGNVFLTHCPIHPQEFDYRVDYNIHGHIHDGYVIEDPRYINVCMEVQDYTPKTLEELLNK